MNTIHVNAKEFNVLLRQGALDAERIARDYRISLEYDVRHYPYAVLLRVPLGVRHQKVCRTLGAECDDREQGWLFQPPESIYERRRPIWVIVFADYLVSLFGEHSAEIMYMSTYSPLRQI